jgi:hypothetical protein
MKTVCFFYASLKILIERSVKTFLIIVLHEIEGELDGTVTNVCQCALTDLPKTMSPQVVNLMIFLI